MTIDRMALVRRHNPRHVGRWVADSPLSVGNGDFAFTADFTGLQTIWNEGPGLAPCLTMSNAGWHRYPDSSSDVSALHLKYYDAGGRKVGYMTDPSGQERLFEDLRINPHKFNLGKIGLAYRAWGPLPPASTVLSHLDNIRQELDLYSGTLDSSYLLDVVPVQVSTVCHPSFGTIAFRIESRLLSEGLGVELYFPYASHLMDGSDWERTGAHASHLEKLPKGGYAISRKMDGTDYLVLVTSSGEIDCVQVDDHRFVIRSAGQKMDLCIQFLFDGEVPFFGDFGAVRAASALWWKRFWEDGAAVSFEGSGDDRAFELERRVVLSQYVTAIQSLGGLPPAETGLTCNSWYGKFHLEMHPWHALHAILWGRKELALRSLRWYSSVLGTARRRAGMQGYEGARWPKMTDMSGFDSPSEIGCLLCWQQPHLILFAELLRRCGDTASSSTLSDLMDETVAFMVEYVRKDGDRYIIGPPVIPAQENHRPEDTLNPTMEVEYWRWALDIAVQWRRRGGRSVPQKWLEVLNHLAPPPNDGHVYLAHELCPDTYGSFAKDHPSFLFAYGFVPGSRIDRTMMAASLDLALKTYDMQSLWGWDFPAMAMTACRLGLGKLAVDLLLLDAPKNTYLLNGHNAQRFRNDLPLYLPGNGALLLAVAMMVTTGSFPEGWSVTAQELSPYL